jgi:23S rRNA (pseudouridine1915-N3)-methyltransferase
MSKIHVCYIGKSRDAGVSRTAEDYIRRAGRFLHCEMRQIRPERFDPWTAYPAATKILLDAAGRALDSAAFTALVARAEMESRDLVFLVGGADGLPPAWRPRADLLLSLSPLTFPHEFARVVLAEQIYRAGATLRGHPYPR